MEQFIQHLEGPPMDNYRDFRHAHEVEIKEWWLYWSPNFVSITMGTLVPTNVDVVVM
jgi:hypothetical protein